MQAFLTQITPLCQQLICAHLERSRDISHCGERQRGAADYSERFLDCTSLRSVSLEMTKYLHTVRQRRGVVSKIWCEREVYPPPAATIRVRLIPEHRPVRKG